MTNKNLLAAALSNEMQLWCSAKDHDHLNDMWSKRIDRENCDLTKQEQKSVAIIQNAGYIIATQVVIVNMTSELAGLMKAYSDIKIAQLHINLE